MLQARRSPSRTTRLRLEPLEERLAPVTRIWSGGGPDNNWSTAANWGATGVPINGDDVQFPATAFTASNNDLPNLSLGPIAFSGPGYVLTGNAIRDGDIRASSTAGTVRIDFAVGGRGLAGVIADTGTTVILNGVLSGSMMQKDGPGELVLNGNNTFAGGLQVRSGTLTVGSSSAVGTGDLSLVGGSTLRAGGGPRTLTNFVTLFSGPSPVTIAGTLDLTLTGGAALPTGIMLNVTNTGLTTLVGGMTGQTPPSTLVKLGTGTLALGNSSVAITVNAGTVLLNGTQFGVGATINAGGTLGGIGTAGVITSAGGTLSPGSSPGILRAAGMTLDVVSTFRVELNGTTPGTGHDQLDATGTATLGGANLVISLGIASTAGNTFVIVQAAQGVIGTFGGLADGAILVAGGKPFRVNYSATAVTLTRVRAATTTALTVAPNPSAFGQAVTATATITSALAGTAPSTGTVTFLDGATTIGTGTVTGGIATLTTSALAAGTHTLTAVYGGDDTYTGSTSTAVSQTVNRAGTTTTLNVTPAASVFGQAVTLTAAVASAVAGVGPPTGTVTFLAGNATIGSVTLVAGTASITTTALGVASHVLTAAYGGDASFTVSTSAPVTHMVARANTTTVVTSSANPVGLFQSVTLTATVSAVAPGAGTPTGTIFFAVFPDGPRHPIRDQTPLGSVALVGGRAQITVANLPAGCRVIVATYQGDASFNPSTSPDFRQSVFVTPHQAYVLALYRDVLERAADLAGFNFWVQRLDTGTSRADVATSFLLSIEYRGVQVDTFYRSLLRRNADPAGRAQWVNALVAGVSEVEIAAAFVSSAEYAATHATAAEYVSGLYADLLGRPADAAGAAYWGQILASGARDRAALAYYFLSSEEAYRKALDDYFRYFLGRPADPQGLAGLLAVLETGSSPAGVAAVFLASPEYFQRVQIATC